MNTVELDEIDLSYESFRLRDRGRERVLLSSISERGILEPLQGVQDGTGRFLLLDGFKRYRCARTLKVGSVVCTSIAEDLACGILTLIRMANDMSLHLVEQARLVSELHGKHGMSVAQIASQLERSPAWVSMRMGLLSEMSPLIKKEVFGGRFPARSFMYSVRQFTRVHKVPAKDVDEFVKAVSGKDLSGRQVDRLARGYFQGGSTFREQIREGNLGWTLNRLEQMERAHTAESVVLTEKERGILKDLEIAQKYEGRIIRHSLDEAPGSSAFFAEAELLVGGVKRQMQEYDKAIGRIYDRCGKAQRDLDSLQTRKRQERDRTAHGCGSKNGEPNHQTGGAVTFGPPQRQDCTGAIVN